MVSFKQLALAVLSATVVSAELNIDADLISAAVGPYATMPGISDLLSVYRKYETVSGFSEFQEGFVNSLLDYAMSADIPTALPTATDPAAILNDPTFKKINSEVAEIITQYIATETYLAMSDKTALASDLLSVSSKVKAMVKETGAAGLAAATASPGSSANGTAAVQTPVPQGGSAAPAPVSAGVKLMAAAGAAVMAVAYVL